LKLLFKKNEKKNFLKKTFKKLKLKHKSNNNNLHSETKNEIQRSVVINRYQRRKSFEEKTANK
jgi:hypothetical protein